MPIQHIFRNSSMIVQGATLPPKAPGDARSALPQREEIEVHPSKERRAIGACPQRGAIEAASLGGNRGLPQNRALKGERSEPPPQRRAIEAYSPREAPKCARSKRVGLKVCFRLGLSKAYSSGKRPTAHSDGVCSLRDAQIERLRCPNAKLSTSR